METEALFDLDIFADEDHRMIMHSPTTDVDKSDMMEPITPITPFDHDEEKLNDENELDLLKSQDSVLWGDEESDEEDFLTNNSYLTAGDILSQRADLNVPSLTTDDMKNIFGSPSSVKSSRSKEMGYGTDSEQSANTESDDEGDADDESDKEEKNSSGSKSKKDKKEKVSLPNKKSAAQTEIDAVKKLESGPTEAELRRRRLIEIDQDEMEDRIERINRVALKAISSATGWSAEEQLKQLRECRDYLMKHILIPEFEDIVEESIDKHNARVYAVEGAPSVDAIAYLKNDKGDWSDVEDEKKKAAAIVAAVTTVKVEEEGMIALSDSDDSDSDSEEVKPVVQPSAAVVVKVEASVTPASAAATAAVCDMERRKALYLAALNKPKSSRAMLLTTLRQKVHETARENYCHQKKIQVDQLAVRLEIFEKSRILVELLKERHESRTLIERESRKQRYLNLNNDEEEEFDDDDMEFEEGQFLTAEEKEELMLQLSREREEEEEEEENNDDIVLSGDDESGDEEGGEKMAVVEEELAGVERTTSSSSSSSSGSKFGSRSSKPVEDGHAAEGANSEEEDEVEVRVSRKSSMASRQPTIEGEQEVDTQLMGELDDEDGEIRPVVTYGRRPSVSVAAANSDAQGEDTMVDSDGEAPAAPEPVVTKKSKAKSGNALYRLGLEEEARRHRNAKKNGLVDDEAEEEEEEGHQAGLGDFGFGVVSKNRENDEERDALKLRKGDLDHIVDDVSEDEGDEEEAVRARVDMEIREDRERTKQVIAAVTEGHDGTRNKKNKGKYSFDRLVADKKRERPVGGEDQPVNEEDELDEEELLQRGLKEKYERDRSSRATKQQQSYDSDSESENEGGDSDTEDNIHAIMASETLTEEEKRSEIEKINQLKETERIEAQRRKQMESYTKMRREVRRQMHNGAGSAVNGGGEVKASALSFLPLEPSATNVVIKRRTTQAPKHLTVNRGHPVIPGGQPHAAPRPGSALPRSASVGVPRPLVRAPSAAQYKGELNQSEVLAGYGMGMAVTSGARKGESVEGFSGLFSTVTGMKRGASDSIALPSSLKRSFSSSVSKRSGTLTSTVASHQFVFNTVSVVNNESSTLMMDSDTKGFSNAGSKLGPTSSLGGGFGGSAGAGGGGAESSLFAKLGNKASLFRNKK